MAIFGQNGAVRAFDHALTAQSHYPQRGTMYRYEAIDQQLLQERIAQFRDQVSRWRAGRMSDDEFRPLRLQNGLYIQRHAPMLRIAIPYGLINSQQCRKLAYIARRYDKGYGHFTTRQNFQLNWPAIDDCPDILAHLAEVEMHAIQTSGNCIRNITTDAYAGVAADELLDPRPIAEILRQWSTFHPEFSWLPRKFKIAISASQNDRTVSWFHDIGLQLYQADDDIKVRVIVGGGLGRTPVRGEVIREDLPWRDLLGYCEAILRVYNRYGRRDKLFMARIKILVKTLGIDAFAKQVDAEWAHLCNGSMTITDAEYARIRSHFNPHAYSPQPDDADHELQTLAHAHPGFGRWLRRSLIKHRVPGYAAAILSLKSPKRPPGDIDADQLDLVADLADRYSFGEVRSTHEQNLVLADVAKTDLFALWQQADAADLATPTPGLLTDIICCPGGDFCDLANAKSIPIALAIEARFDQLDYLYDLGEIDLNISGCMNACGHHHVGHIGILGVDKNDAAYYQITLGGRQGNNAQLGKIIGPSFAAAEIPDVVAAILNVYVEHRHSDETFLDTLDRVGLAPFKDHVYANRAHGRSNAND